MSKYKDAGVDVEAGYKAVKLMSEHVNKTFRPEVLGQLGGFGGMFALNTKKYKEPVLISGTDGVGTKLKVAFMMNKHDTIGVDCVAMCVNDIICSGAEPLFFLDYLAVGKNYPEKVEEIVKGVADGCIMSNCSLIGGETAEMPGFYPKDEYDVAGFVVGVVEKSKIIDGKNIKTGDKLIGLASSGLHSNGFSLVRRMLNLNENNIHDHIETLGSSLGEELLKPTKIYVKTILVLTEKYEIKGISHITGGGFIENIPRMLPEGVRAKIKLGSWPVHPIFNLLKNTGNMTDEEIYNTFNMGIGMVIVVDSKIASEVVKYINEGEEKAYIIGSLVSGEAGVNLC